MATIQNTAKLAITIKWRLAKFIRYIIMYNMDTDGSQGKNKYDKS